MKSMTIKAFAKINLHLDVASKAENGYHEVRTVMQSISLCDLICVELSWDNGISLECDVAALPCDSRNLAYKAAALFFEKTGVPCGVRIKIEKRIPMAAGLAGGSADAAAVLYALNEIFEKPLDCEGLLALGARLGADVPFCIACGTKYADGYGQVLHNFPRMPKCYIVAACAGEGVSTPWAYAALDKRYSDFSAGIYTPCSVEPLREAVESGDVAEISARVYNIFEGVIAPERPMVSLIKNKMTDFGALNAIMSGSGPSVYGIFDSEKNANCAKNALCDIGIPAFVCEPTAERF